MQIVKYEINKSILIVGFKEDNFVVYTQIGFNSTKSKPELLQEAYEQCRDSIEYEKLQIEPSFISQEIGGEFIPAPPKPLKLDIDFECLKGKVIDQYMQVYSIEIQFFIEGTDKAYIEGNKIFESVVLEDTPYSLIAKWGGVNG